ncbi:cytochrome c biogenesis protein CcdA [Ferrovibrio terrae]|uniref:Cytochrome c biogenesis protein CcdA n=1 Tax=Ferrovibrio terrae TaxID=2594003 RepID=A0A516H4A8_9PROT|nr:cytochrome c biogenesis protein CcdA [Ferrovibrio terrae]QDO98460.1 cytochrome c biogenesis protein CcdA [Ferrovibrio terrae]
MGGLDISYAGAAGAGLISFLSPCVLPLVPAYLSFMAGTTLESMLDDAGAARSATTRRVFVSALAFVIGFSTVFIAMGASASALNRLILENIDIIGKIAGAVIVLFGLHYMGLLKIPLLYREARFHTKENSGGLVGAYLLGLAFAFGWTPCVGPILATILTVAASRDELGYGISLLATYALGLGIPFLLAALAVRPFMRFMQRFRRHLRKVEFGAGALLVLTGILIFTNSLGQFSYFLLDLFPWLATIG